MVLAATTPLEVYMHSTKSLFLSVAIVGLLAGACGSSSDDTTDMGTSAIEQGKALVTKNVCSSCHGAKDGTLSGQTTPQPGTKAYPPNLTPDMDTGLGSWDTATIVNAILHGVDDEGEMLCGGMPVYSKLGMSEDDATHIAAYLKSLAPVKSEIPESTCE
jgi:mono/diheme cytochrome c family protein